MQLLARSNLTDLSTYGTLLVTSGPAFSAVEVNYVAMVSARDSVWERIPSKWHERYL